MWKYLAVRATTVCASLVISSLSQAYQHAHVSKAIEHAVNHKSESKSIKVATEVGLDTLKSVVVHNETPKMKKVLGTALKSSLTVYQKNWVVRPNYIGYQTSF